MKGIQLYHVRGNGWNDIGYNYLVDRFGTVYEGRYGGIDKAVVGAHARGFNTGSAGIALLGTYSGQAPTKAAQGALTSLIAWRLDVAHVDPLSMQNVISSGSERWAAKVPVLLRAVSGHRDTGFTECPGGTLYSRLNQIAADAAKLGGPKIFDPRVEASAEGPVRFRARLSQATLVDGHGHERRSRGRSWHRVREDAGLDVGCDLAPTRLLPLVDQRRLGASGDGIGQGGSRYGHGHDARDLGSGCDARRHHAERRRAG